jgi:hypothetical protein
MPMAKLGSISLVDTNEIQSRHMELDSKFWEALSMMTVDEKFSLLARIPGVLTEIRNETQAREQGI